MKCKNHVKKKYKGIQIDLYQDMDASWFSFIPNRVNPLYRTPNYKHSSDAVLDCKKKIDKHPEKYHK